MYNPSPLRYPGGKQRAVSQILPLIPEEVTHLYSPFFGGGSVEFAWAQANPKGKVIGRDLFEPVVTFWQQTLNRAAVVAELAQAQYYPMDKGMFRTLQILLRNGQGTDLSRAARFFAVNRSSFSGATLSGGMGNADRFSLGAIDKLRKFAAPNVEIRKSDALTFLRRRREKFSAPGAFVFLDPPYLLKDGKNKLYGSNGSTHDGFSHEALQRRLVRLNDKGALWLMTYNNCPEVHELYSKFHRRPKEWKYGMSNKKNGKELFIFSDALWEALNG